MDLWIINITLADIVIEDLGIIIESASSYQVLPEYELDDIQHSDDLEFLINDDQVLLSENGTQNLSKQSSLDILTPVSKEDIDGVSVSGSARWKRILGI